MNIETSIADSLMDQFFALGPAIMEIIESPENALQLMTMPLGLGILASFVLLLFLLKAIGKHRARKALEEQRLSELEAALLDEDFEERALPINDSAPAETWETEEDIARIMESEPGWEEEQLHWDDDPDTAELLNPQLDHGDKAPEDDRLWQDQDPEFSNQIRITAQSRRMSPPEEDTLLPSPPPEDTFSHAQEIEEEFQQLEADLKSKTLEVERKHRLYPDQTADSLDNPSQTDRLAEPLALSLDDLVEEEAPEENLFDNEDELADLFEEEQKTPLAISPDNEIDHEMQDTLESFSDSLKDLSPQVASTGLEPETDPLADMLLPDEPEEKPEPIKAVNEAEPSIAEDPNKAYIDKLETFKSDMENRFQSLSLESITEKNSDLVHALNDSSEEEERIEALHQQKREVDLLASMMFVGGRKRH